MWLVPHSQRKAQQKENATFLGTKIRQADKANSKQSSNNSQEYGVRKANMKIYCETINKTA